MSKKQFYSHLLGTWELEMELDSLELSQNEKNELLEHVHSSIHYKVLDTVLSDLSEEDKKIVIKNINNENHEKIWEHLLRSVVGIEEKIKVTAKNIVEEFLEDVKKTRNDRKS